MVWGNTLGLAVALAFLTHAAPGTAAERQKPLGVVELFTSQGCNSCPPADAVFGDLAREGKVVALAYHVNYWDYLGWRDTLSSDDATQRQYDYMSALGTQSVYTPQAVVNGRAHMNAARRGEVESALRSMAQGNTGLQVGVSATRSGDSVVIETDAAPKPVGEAHVLLVYFDGVRPVAITRGENSGRTVTYYNAVRSLQTAGMWHGQAARFEMPLSEMAKKGENCAVLLQATGKDGAPGPILGAAVVSTTLPTASR